MNKSTLNVILKIENFLKKENKSLSLMLTTDGVHTRWLSHNLDMSVLH